MFDGRSIRSLSVTARKRPAGVMLWRALCIRERFVPSPRSGMPLGKRVSVLPKEDKSVADGLCRFAGKDPSPE